MPVKLLLVLAYLAPPCRPGPVEFGWRQLQRAIVERQLNPLRLRLVAEISASSPPETFEIAPNRISGGDLRGLMYGLLEAAEQIRTRGRLQPTRQQPAAAVRGVRLSMNHADWEQRWFHSRSFWSRFFEMLARNRLNRFQLAFGNQTDFWTPPYAFLFETPLFAHVEVKDLAAWERRRNLEALQRIAQTASDYGIDFVFGVWRHTPNTRVSGLAEDWLTGYTRAALRHLLAEVGEIRALYFHAAGPEQAQRILEEAAFPACAAAGRLVTLEIPAQFFSGPLMEEARRARVSLRLHEHLSQALPYPSPQSLRLYPLPVLRSLPASQWVDPEFVQRLLDALSTTATLGFEVEGPAELEQTEAEFFYQTWGRLSYPQHALTLKPGPELTGIQAAHRCEQEWAIASSAGLFQADAEESAAHHLGTRKTPRQTLFEASQRLLGCAQQVEQAAAARRPADLAARLRTAAAQARFRAHRLLARQALAASAIQPNDVLLRAAASAVRSLFTAAANLPEPDPEFAAERAALEQRLLQIEATLDARQTAPDSAPAALPWAVRPEPPRLFHQPPRQVDAGAPLRLQVTVSASKAVTGIRLHYRMVEDSNWRTLTLSHHSGVMTIPAAHLQGSRMVVYFFEVLNSTGGWIDPDPRLRPAYAVRVVPDAALNGSTAAVKKPASPR